jgi:UDP-N-acetylmuramoyl-L-alanyl-D-glutamate--2,6-diaminopimelate ligase
MTWSELSTALRDRGGLTTPAGAASPAIPVTGIAWDSRQVEPGQVFVGLKGQHVDGATFSAQAIARGAAAVVSEGIPPDGVGVPWAVVPDARLALALLAAEFYGHPSAEMQVVGITGTNGKTTTAHLIASIFEAARVPCSVIGTVGYRIAGRMRPASQTTPEAPVLQALLRDGVVQGSRACAMEVSSHALALRRVDGTTFAAAVFTNLTRDHLDFHGDMESYFQAKRRLFEMLPADAPRT